MSGIFAASGPYTIILPAYSFSSISMPELCAELSPEYWTSTALCVAGVLVFKKRKQIQKLKALEKFISNEHLYLKILHTTPCMCTNSMH